MIIFQKTKFVNAYFSYKFKLNRYKVLSFIVDVASVRCQIPHVRFTQAATSKKLSIMPDTWAGVCRTYLSGLLVKLTLAYFS